MKILRFSVTVLALLSLAMAFMFSEPVHLEGYLMPLKCDKREPGRGPAHTTECALEPDCVASGFGLWTAESFTKFDSRGNQLALEYFHKTDREKDHKVRVTGGFEGEILHVKEIVPISN